MKYYAHVPVSEFLGDQLVYRNLVPMDPALPDLESLRESLGLPPGVTPRKTTPEYAQVIAHILKAAHQIQAPGTNLQRVIFIGDTRLNDSTAFANICRAGNWIGWAFIGSQDRKPPRYDIQSVDVGSVTFANRWEALDRFENSLVAQGVDVNERTAVLLDLDKTTLGARGRNDKVIDQARVEAAFMTARDLLGSQFDPDAFQVAYQELNQVEYHPFTTDNQDYLVYICLLVASELFDLSGLTAQIRSGHMADFGQFLRDANGRVSQMGSALRDVHLEVMNRVRAGDPTPFKVFRQNEYIATLSRLGQAGPDTPIDERLKQEIVITQEVRALALKWRRQGALLFGLSDKPDEASIPSNRLDSQGYLPIHQISTSVVGA